MKEDSSDQAMYIASFSLFLSIMAAGLCIAALCRTYPRTADLGFDYIGVLVGILALLVTVLIGWQVFNAIQMQNTLKEIDGKMKEEVEDYDHTVSAVISQISTIFQYFDDKQKTKKDNGKAFLGLAKALEEAKKGSRNGEAISGIISFLTFIVEEEKEEKELSLNNNDIDYCLKVLSDTTDSGTGKITAFLEKIQESKTQSADCKSKK